MIYLLQPLLPDMAASLWGFDRDCVRGRECGTGGVRRRDLLAGAAVGAGTAAAAGDRLTDMTARRTDQRQLASRIITSSAPFTRLFSNWLVKNSTLGEALSCDRESAVRREGEVLATYDRVQTTRRIFDAAVREFAAEGISGARVDRIAKMAGSNKALIYHYFGNKEELFAAVLQRRLTDLAEAVELNPDHVDTYIGDLFDFMTANPDVLKLVQHEAAHFSFSDIPQRDPRKRHYDEKTAAVRAAQQTGKIDGDLDPGFVIESLISLVSWFVAAPQITDMVIGDPNNEDLHRRYRAHLVEMAGRMLRTPTADDRLRGG